MTVCVHCSLKVIVEGLEQGKGLLPPTFFNEHPLEHVLKVHPDGEACVRERADLMRRLDVLVAEGKAGDLGAFMQAQRMAERAHYN